MEPAEAPTSHPYPAPEGEKYSPSLEVGFKIAEVFGVPLERVFRYGPEADAD